MAFKSVSITVHKKAESELIGLTKRVRGLEEDFESTESRLLNTSTKLDEASKASDENERYVTPISWNHGATTACSYFRHFNILQVVNRLGMGMESLMMHCIENLGWVCGGERILKISQ